MTREEQYKILHNTYGETLPELGEEYINGSAVFDEIADNHVLTPYLLRELFTPEEMRIVNTLPATAEEAAAKLGLDVEYVRTILDKINAEGKLVDDDSDPKLYGVYRRAVTFRDSIVAAGMRGDMSYVNNRKAFTLMENWIRFSSDTKMPLEDILEMRVIPKWNSIKDLPGVMRCENMLEIIEDNLKKGTIIANLCGCRAVKSYIDIGGYSPDNCKVFHENEDNSDGHCLMFEEFAAHMIKKYPAGQNIPNREQAMKVFREVEESTAIYSGAKTRQIANVCTCCDCCCTVQQHIRDGLTDVLRPSRFRPECNGDKCIGCQICLSRCYYDAIHLTDNGVEINPDKCKGCGNCVVTCPTKALKMKTVHGPEWIPDEIYVNDFEYNG